jgi:uncharacterized membrane protein YecN with MAPEG domain
MRLIRHIAETLGIALFSMALPFLFVSALVWGQKSGMSADEVWLVKVVGAVLMPFGAVLWVITISNLVFRRRAGLVKQLVAFFGTAFLLYLLLSAGVYSFR